VKSFFIPRILSNVYFHSVDTRLSSGLANTCLSITKDLELNIKLNSTTPAVTDHSQEVES